MTFPKFTYEQSREWQRLLDAQKTAKIDYRTATHSVEQAVAAVHDVRGASLDMAVFDEVKEFATAEEDEETMSTMTTDATEETVETTEKTGPTLDEVLRRMETQNRVAVGGAAHKHPVVVMSFVVFAIADTPLAQYTFIMDKFACCVYTLKSGRSSGTWSKVDNWSHTQHLVEKLAVIQGILTDSKDFGLGVVGTVATMPPYVVKMTDKEQTELFAGRVPASLRVRIIKHFDTLADAKVDGDSDGTTGSAKYRELLKSNRLTTDIAFEWQRKMFEL